MNNASRIYLDANGGSPVITEAKTALSLAMDFYGNPSSSHQEGRNLRALIDEARHFVAVGAGAIDREVIFTSGASEANRLFIDAVVEDGRLHKTKPRVLMSIFEHPSLYKPAMRAFELGSIELSFIENESNGALRFNAEQIFSADIIIVCQAHNETGILPDLAEILSLVRPDTLVMSDIAQGYARLLAPPSRVDVMTLSAQKIGGYPGVGALILRGNAKKLPAPWLGGGQERGYRPGTESLALIHAFGAAAALVSRQRYLYQEVLKLRDYFEDALRDRALVKIIGKDLPRLPNTSAICFLNEEPDALRIACDMAGLSAGFGAACSGLAPEGSFALKRLNLSQREEKTTVRFSFPAKTTLDDVCETIKRLHTHVLSRNRT